MRLSLLAVLLLSACSPVPLSPTVPQNQAVADTMANVQKAVAKNWFFLPQTGGSLPKAQVSVIVKIKPGGEVTDVHMGRSSGDKYFDSSLIYAVRRSSPLPIPASQYDVFKEMELFFDPALAPPAYLSSPTQVEAMHLKTRENYQRAMNFIESLNDKAQKGK